MEDEMHEGETHAVLPSESGAGYDSRDIAGSNLSFLRVVELGVAAILAHHVGHVVRRRSQEEMRRVDTERVVAVMADEQPGGDWPAM
jgi:hypothetical protein